MTTDTAMENIPALLRRTAAERAAEPAILLPERSLSFGEIDAATDALAGALAVRGIAKGDRIALYCPNSEAFAICYFGIIKAGAVVVPINLLLNPREVRYILADAGVKGLLYFHALAEAVSQFRDAVSSPGLCVAISGAATSDEQLDALLAERAPGATPAFDPAEELAAILYTSGTTGHPKGAMLTHRNLLSNAHSVTSALQLRPGNDRLLLVLPMFHSFAATVGMLTPLLHGLAFAPLAKFDPVQVSEAIVRFGATIFLGVPSMYNLLLRLSDRQVEQWRTVRFCVSGGAAMPVEVMRRFEARFGVPVLEGDGPTECSPVTCVNPLDGERKPGSVGLSIKDVDIAIFDDGGARLPCGMIGEICVRGPNVMKGYWNQPDATAESFFGEWLRTGDLGYKDGDGYLFIVDRKKEMIIVNGMNVYPRIIEEVLHRYPGLAEAAVVGEPHELHGEIPVAYVVALPGATLDGAEIRAFCRDRLGRHEVPRKVVVRGPLPRNAAGKLLKRELRKDGELERGIDSRDQA